MDKIGDRWSDTIRELNDAQAEIQQLRTQLADKEDLWDRASRQADTLAEYLVDAKAELSVANDQLATAQAVMKSGYTIAPVQNSPEDLRVYELNSEDPCGYATPIKGGTDALDAAIEEATKELRTLLATAKKEEARWHIAYSHLNTKAEAWRLTAKGKEEAYVKRELQLAAAQAALLWYADDKSFVTIAAQGYAKDALADGTAALNAAIAAAVEVEHKKFEDRHKRKIIENDLRHAEATKPLVDALTQIADEKRHGAAAWRIAKDALAQLK